MNILDWLRRKRLRPGQRCPASGQYRNSKTDKQCTSTKGEPMPPGPAGSRWALTDPTRHQGDSSPITPDPR
jgi:hypothetical protein